MYEELSGRKNMQIHAVAQEIDGVNMEGVSERARVGQSLTLVQTASSCRGCNINASREQKSS